MLEDAFLFFKAYDVPRRAYLMRLGLSGADFYLLAAVASLPCAAAASPLLMGVARGVVMPVHVLAFIPLTLTLSGLADPLPSCSTYCTLGSFPSSSA